MSLPRNSQPSKPLHHFRLRSLTPSTMESVGIGTSTYLALRDKGSRRGGRAFGTGGGTWERIRRRPKVISSILGTMGVVWGLWWLLGDVILLARFKLRDKAYEEGWISGCGLRKRPLLFVRGDGEVAVVWETNCEQEFEILYGIKGGSMRGVEAGCTQMPDKTGTHWVYSAVMGELEGGESYTYSIVLASSPSSRPLASHTFPWLGQQPQDADEESTTIEIAALADNQFNLRTFHHILLSLLSFSPTSPSLIIHAGDHVQNPHNLAQWQTDFWDPFTSSLPRALGQVTPVLLARGNHDWDATGQNVYTGGSPPRKEWAGRGRGENHPGTFMAYSPHERVRIIVLDSNVGEREQEEQEEWLEWELGRREWKRASLRIVVVHVPPFLEFWDKENWNEGGESRWSTFVRTRLTPLLSLHETTLIMSGHSHAYSRGFLPSALVLSYTSSPNSSSLPSFALATALERPWQKSQGEAKGTVYTVFGGAGGSFDLDRVEEWGFYEKSVREVHHFVWISLHLGSAGPEVEQGTRVYTVGRREECEGREVRDRLRWRAVAVDGKVFDEFWMEVEGCR